MSVVEKIIDMPADISTSVFGQRDEYAKKIERTLKVTIIARNSDIKVIGDSKGVEHAVKVLNNLSLLARRGNVIQEQNVDYALLLPWRKRKMLCLKLMKI